MNNILHRRLRAWLTLLGIIIGVGALVSIISITEGANASLQENLSSFGSDVITVNPGGFRAGIFGGGFRGGTPVFNQQPASSTEEPELGKLDLIIIRGHPNVQYVNETVSGRGEFVFLSEKSSVNIQGVNPSTFVYTDNVELEAGRPLGASDSSAIIIGYRLANETFKQPITLGRRVTIEGQPFTIAGILAEGVNDSAGYIKN